jgi:hypothetical protein
VAAWSTTRTGCGGETSEANLAGYCLHHHKLKHHGG